MEEDQEEPDISDQAQEAAAMPSGSGMNKAHQNDDQKLALVFGDVIRNIRPPGKNRNTYKMVFVANMSLKMGVGKLCAQVGHATLGVYRVAQKSHEVSVCALFSNI